MAEFKVALGAIADVASSKELEHHMSGLQGHIDKKFQHYDNCKPLRRKVVCADVIGPHNSVSIGQQTANLLVANQFPSKGRVWSIRTFSLFSSDFPFSVTTGIGYAICSGDNVNPGVSDFVAISTTPQLPTYNTFGRHGFTVIDGEKLYVLLTGVSNTQHYCATFVVEDWAMEDYAAMGI